MEHTGRPTAMLSREILLTPALRFIALLKVSFGFSKLPYAVPARNLSKDRSFSFTRTVHLLYLLDEAT